MSGTGPRACAECLRRAWLVASLAGHIETAVDRTPGSRAREVLALPDDELARAMTRSDGVSFLDRASALEPERMLAAVAKSGGWATCRHDDAYPSALGDLGDAPPAIFGRGNAALLPEHSLGDAVTIVGSRRPSRYGLDVARALGHELASAGMTVVSGMALGIDAAAHDGALEARGRTIAVP